MQTSNSNRIIKVICTYLSYRFYEWPRHPNIDNILCNSQDQHRNGCQSSQWVYPDPGYNPYHHNFCPHNEHFLGNYNTHELYQINNQVDNSVQINLLHSHYSMSLSNTWNSDLDQRMSEKKCINEKFCTKQFYVLYEPLTTTKID